MRPEPKYSIIVPTMGDPDLLECLLDSLKQTAQREYQVCLGFDPAGHTASDRVFSAEFPMTFQVAKKPGMSAALNAAFSKAEGDWIIWVCDDMVFLPGWDSFFGFRPGSMLQPRRILCFELLEPHAGSFPPPCEAGETPAEFRRDIAEAESARRAFALRDEWTVPGGYFGSGVLHRSAWRPWPEWPDPYSVNDIAWVWETMWNNQDLAFGRLPGNCLYHFVRGSVRSRPNLLWDAASEFEQRYGMTIQGAWNTVYETSKDNWEDTHGA